MRPTTWAKGDVISGGVAATGRATVGIIAWEYFWNNRGIDETTPSFKEERSFRRLKWHTIMLRL